MRINIFPVARRASLFFLFCLLTALLALPIKGALAGSGHHNPQAAPQSATRISDVTHVAPQSLAGGSATSVQR